MNRNLEENLYLIVHNIDGPMLRNEKAQAVLADLAAHSKVKIIF
jgi:Origin recognition complex subunit 2